jgi:hypothetical protein
MLIYGLKMNSALKYICSCSNLVAVGGLLAVLLSVVIIGIQTSLRKRPDKQYFIDKTI